MMQKDLNLALELGRRLEVPLPTTAVTNELLTAANGMGIGERDFAVVFDVLAAMSGVETEILAGEPRRPRPPPRAEVDAGLALEMYWRMASIRALRGASATSCTAARRCPA